MRKSKLIIGVLALFIFSIVATGCVFGPKDEDASAPIDPPQINYEEDSSEVVIEWEDSEVDEEGSVEMESAREIERELFVFDHQGYVVPLTVKLPFSEGVATQALEYLVVDGPVTELLPDGMRAVLPAGTELSVKVDTSDKTATVNFSKEFANYQAQDEKGILEAITWTLTQFDTIDQVVIRINGYEQKVMPVNGTPIGQSLSRKDGINVEVADGTQIGHNSVVTLYFKAQNLSATNEYFVPVSRIVSRSENLVEATVRELVAGPKFKSGLFSDIITSTQVDIKVDGTTATLDFDEQFLRYAAESAKASDDALKSLVFSLTESGLVEQVQFMVNGDSNLVSAQGTDLAKPVSRPITVNATGF